MTRAERRAMKKAQKNPQSAAKKTGDDDDEDEEDELLTNANRVKDKLKISDATESQPLSRKERCLFKCGDMLFQTTE